MSARTKLNAAYFNGCLLLAAIVGAAAQSWAVFLLALAVLVGGCVIGGEIRPAKRSR